mmetsp:Transcript_86487/g.231783  ORF Transcript_86487/g.231783 Transcript_86487/m.231783 type:complete len:207 (-) Transcript_86487:1661-2281(-)
MYVNPAGASIRISALCTTVARSLSTVAIACVVRNANTVGFSHASLTTFFGSTWQFSRVWVRKPGVPMEATGRSVSLTFPVNRYWSIHQRLGIGVAAGTMQFARNPYSKPARRFMRIRRLNVFGSSGLYDGMSVAISSASIAALVEMYPRLLPSQDTPMGALMFRKSSNGTFSENANVTTTGLDPAARDVGRTEKDWSSFGNKKNPG